MNLKLLPCLALVLSFILTGCETETICQSRFVITNLNGDGRAETNTNIVAGPYGGLFDGRMMTTFSLGTPSNSLVLFYPTNRLNQITEWPADSSQAKAWLVNTPLDKLAFPSLKNVSDVPYPDSVALRGTIKAGRFDWRHKNRHYLALDLTGTNGFAIRGEMNAYDKTRFDAKQLWLDPYILIVGPFVAW